MGQTILYFKNNFNKGLKDIIFENYPSFRQWYLDTDKFSIEEYNEQYGNEMLIKYFKQDRDLTSDFGKLDNRLIDELTAEFILNYYDRGYSDLIGRNIVLLEEFGPPVNKWRYGQSDEMVFATQDDDLIRLWNFIVKGRSLKDNSFFESYANDFKIGFLTLNECKFFKEKVEFYFGDIETIKDRYWTAEEKKKLQKAKDESKNGFYSLSDHNPKSSGLEYVLIAINVLDNRNAELITGIDA